MEEETGQKFRDLAEVIQLRAGVGTKLGLVLLVPLSPNSESSECFLSENLTYSCILLSISAMVFPCRYFICAKCVTDVFYPHIPIHKIGFNFLLWIPQHSSKENLASFMNLSHLYSTMFVSSLPYPIIFC